MDGRDHDAHHPDLVEMAHPDAHLRLPGPRRGQGRQRRGVGHVVRVARQPDLGDDGAIHYSGTWSVVTGQPFWGGATKKSTQKGASATLDTTARMVAWIARMGPDRGTASVYVDGTKVATVDLNATSLRDQRVVWSMRWSSSTLRTLKIVVDGTAGHPRVDLDEIVLGG